MKSQIANRTDSSRASWMPCNKKLLQRQPKLNLLKIDYLESKQNLFTSQLKYISIFLYRKYLKKHNTIRNILIYLWTNSLPHFIKLYSLICFKNLKQWRLIKKLNHFSSTNYHKIVFNKNQVNRLLPRILGKKKIFFDNSLETYYVFPEIYISLIENASIFGSTNLIVFKKNVICHDLYNWETDYSAEEFNHRFILNNKFTRILYLTEGKSVFFLDKAAVFVDALSSNYAHWLSEVLPRIAVFCSIQEYKDVPIVIDDGLHPNIMESLGLVVGSSRQVILLPRDRTITVGELYITSVCGYVPYDRRYSKAIVGEGMFSPDAFKELVSSVITSTSVPIDCNQWPKKIYIRRNSSGRSLINNDEIEDVVSSFGYEIIEPEKLTFYQQALLFKGAVSIISTSGAALANLIFCKEDVHILILISESKEISYLYWQNMASASGKSVAYILGERSNKISSGIHDDFYVNPDELIDILESI